MLKKQSVYYFKTTSPQGDGNQQQSADVNNVVLISKPHPRKGTETCTITYPKFMIKHFKTTSPQGDGNILQWTFSGSCSYNFKTTSPQGDGNWNPIQHTDINGVISKPHPRKGTETNIEIILSLKRQKFQNHIPARGRKLHDEPSYTSAASDISKPHPRKGTETNRMLEIEPLKLKFQNHILARGRKQTGC